MRSFRLQSLARPGIDLAQEVIEKNHYLHRPVDPRCSVEGYAVNLYAVGNVGFLLLGRPQATRVHGWYGSVEDVAAGRCEVTRWQVLNLARVWLDPEVQAGGFFCNPLDLPGFLDRRGLWHPAFASAVLRMVIQRVGFDYLMSRPPCFLDEPYEIRWLMSYCDTRLHKGTIYRAAGFELYPTQNRFIQTWRVRLPALTPDQDMAVRQAARVSRRSQAYRAARAQLRLPI